MILTVHSNWQKDPFVYWLAVKDAHTDPIFKNLKLSKIQDIFHVQNLKIDHKYKKAKRPQYFMDMFTINTDMHPYGSRQSSHLHHGITAKARKCIRYLLPTLIIRHKPFLTRWKHVEVETKWPPFSRRHFLEHFSWVKMNEFRLKSHWSLFLRDQLTMSQHWFR